MIAQNFYLGLIVCFLDLVAAFVIIALMLETTKHANVGSFFHRDAQGAWAMARRVVYAGVAFALFAKSVLILDGKIQVQGIDALLWAMVVFPLILFPALRAMGAVDQDRWIGFRRRAVDGDADIH